MNEMMHGAGAWTRDPDHSGAMRRARAAASAPQHAPHGVRIPGGLGGAQADGMGNVLVTPESRAASLERMWDALRATRIGGIPAATAAGDLPVGIHQATWGAVVERFSHGERRSDLTRQLGAALGAMRAAGVEQVVVGGSYVGTKPHPGDVDLVVIPRADQGRLNIRAIQRAVAQVAPDVHAYAAESVVRNSTTIPGAVPGENFLELFQHTRTGAARGALLLHPQPSATGAVSGALAGIARLVRR